MLALLNHSFHDYKIIHASVVRTEAIPNGTLIVIKTIEVQLYRSRIVNIETHPTSNHKNPSGTLGNKPLISHTLL